MLGSADVAGELGTQSTCHGLDSCSACSVRVRLGSPKTQTAPWVAGALASPDVAPLHQALPVYIQGDAFSGALQLLVPAGLQDLTRISQVIICAPWQSWPASVDLCRP